MPVERATEYEPDDGGGLDEQIAPGPVDLVLPEPFGPARLEVDVLPLGVIAGVAVGGGAVADLGDVDQAALRALF